MLVEFRNLKILLLTMDVYKTNIRPAVEAQLLPLIPVVSALNELCKLATHDNVPVQVHYVLGFLQNHPADVALFFIILTIYVLHRSFLLAFVLEPVITALIPAISAFRAIEHQQLVETGFFLLYFVSFGLLKVLEHILPLRESSPFFYPYIKSAVMLALYHPTTQGISLVNGLFFEPYLYPILGLGTTGSGREKRNNTTAKKVDSFVDLSNLHKVKVVTVTVREVTVTEGEEVDEKPPSQTYATLATLSNQANRKFCSYEAIKFKTGLNPKNVKKTIHVHPSLDSQIAVSLYVKETFGTDPKIGSAVIDLSNFSKMTKKMSNVLLDFEGGSGSVLVDVCLQDEEAYIE